MNFATTDLVVLIGYLLIMMGFGIWIANKEKNENAKDYFLASSALPWWAVGGSLIASNISTEQILGMNGSGYVMGLAIAAYELLAALTLILVAKFLLPVFINKKIFTMPQFLEERFDRRVRTLMAFFWVGLFVLVNISSVLYLGGLAIESIVGVELLWGIAGLVIYSATLSIFGGLKAVVWTDVVQVVILIVGGLTAAYMVLTFVGDGSLLGGINHLYEKAPEHFDMILSKDNPSYSELPGISVLVGGLWIANIYYWGTNQYIIQRALASKSLKEAQRGVAFASFMKLLIPVFAVLPGIAAYVILKDPAAYGFSGEGLGINEEGKVIADEAFPWVLGNFVQIGFKGLVLAALIAAIGSSVSSMVNSASTIFTLDIYKNLFAKNESENHYVKIGRISATAALLLGAFIAPALGNLDQVFQYIQEYTGFISPGVVAVFLFGMFWKRATANAALAAVVASIPFSWAMQALFPEVPFIVRIALGFLVMSGLIVLISVLENKAAETKRAKEMPFILGLVFSIILISVPAGVRILVGDIETSNVFGLLILGLSAIIFALLFTENKIDDKKAIHLEHSLFKTDAVFNISSVAVCLILAVIYWMLW